MNELFKESLDLLVETSNLFEQLNPIDGYMSIFEAENPDIKQQETKNESILKKIADKIIAVAKKLIGIVDSIISNIKNKIDEKRLDAKEKQLFEQFKEAAKNNPDLKNQKVTVRDFTAARAGYEKILKEVEEQMNKKDIDKKEVVEKLYGKISEYIENIPKAVTATVSIDAALRYAKSERLFAQAMVTTLNATKGEQDKLIKLLGGEKNYKKFESEMKTWSKRQSLRRYLLGLQGKTCSSLLQAYSDTIRDIKRVVSGKDVVGGLVASRNLISKTMNNEDLKDVAKGSIKAGIAAKTIKKKIDKKKEIKNKLAERRAARDKKIDEKLKK